MPQNSDMTFTEFHNVQYQNSKMIWIKGGGGNTRTGARPRGDNFETVTFDGYFMLEPERFKPFWLTWSEVSLDVVFGVGNHIGSGQTIRFNRDPTFTLNILYTGAAV
ncbi:hypothetical protein LOTGIDRAFT_158229 [Lottia gigantea]|uniref:Farnesoic acid O-methyl transferase domain-containing protein n=1 Tax=Lottia gigantea TaxID=225164 RepID=V4AY88_LOTGI|nr:hypothetical protein LOTGIDRAFT_158229 [Lottia gigantea]ESP00006.1 hypothetical protein LOTGIDRAFT_158229 [Lottia gigantea]